MSKSEHKSEKFTKLNYKSSLDDTDDVLNELDAAFVGLLRSTLKDQSQYWRNNAQPEHVCLDPTCVFTVDYARQLLQELTAAWESGSAALKDLPEPFAELFNEVQFYLQLGSEGPQDDEENPEVENISIGVNFGPNLRMCLGDRVQEVSPEPYPFNLKVYGPASWHVAVVVLDSLDEGGSPMSISDPVQAFLEHVKARFQAQGRSSEPPETPDLSDKLKWN